MAALRVLTADGEENARRRLRDLLAIDPECELIGEYSNGIEAIGALDRVKPDVVFVDVQTPARDGFEVARAISNGPPLVIFTSRHGEHALRAFEAQVFDYLLKPLEEHRFHDAIGRAKARLACVRTATPAAGFPELLERLPRAWQAPKRIAVRENGRVVFLRLDELDWIEAADNYVALHCGARTHVLRETMNEVEGRLDPTRFIRVHRSAIVNIDRIRELQPWFRGDFRVVLLDGTELTLTKTNREKLDSQLLLGAIGR